MKIIIDLPEEVYESAKNGTLNEIQSMYICGSVVEGTPLPKEHGRLVILSENALKREQISLSDSCQNWISEVGLSNATVAIIDADMGKENE